MRTILTGQPITSQDAMSWGLLCDLVEDEKLMQQTIALAVGLTEHGPEAMQLAKEAICRGMVPRSLWHPCLSSLCHHLHY